MKAPREYTSGYTAWGTPCTLIWVNHRIIDAFDIFGNHVQPMEPQTMKRSRKSPVIARIVHPSERRPEPKPVVPPLVAADVLKAGHVYHPQFVRWLAERGVDASRRQARKFLAANPVLRRAWESVWKEHKKAA